MCLTYFYLSVIQTVPWAHQALYSVGTHGSFTTGKVTMAIRGPPHLHLVTRFKLGGAISPHLHTPLGPVQAHLYFTLNMQTDTTSPSHYVASTTKFQDSTTVDTI